MSQDIAQLIEKAQRELRGMTGDVAFLSDLITALETLQRQLAEQAAVIEKKDEALEVAERNNPDKVLVTVFSKALALTASPEILRERDAETVRNVAGIVGGDAEKELNRIAQRIEKGEV
jgi:hypothetical protein